VCVKKLVSQPNIKVSLYQMLVNANELLKNHTMWFSGFLF